MCAVDEVRPGPDMLRIFAEDLMNENVPTAPACMEPTADKIVCASQCNRLIGRVAQRIATDLDFLREALWNWPGKEWDSHQISRFFTAFACV